MIQLKNKNIMPELFIESNEEIAMKYEKLILGVFGLFGIYQDSLAIAAADYYSSFVDEENLKSFHSNKISLGIVIGAISLKYPEGTHIERLKVIEGKLKEADKQSQIIEIIEELIILFRNI